MTSPLTHLNDSRRIHRLPDLLISQIAAGEVVERPASVVKELVENAIDAEASRIEVHLKQGGIEEIAVLDNGTGMSPEDLRVCVERHTTSKIEKEADLSSIATFGFRGEALSSICSVAQVEIRTRRASDAFAHCLNINFGESEGELRPQGAPQGTGMYVRRLFSQLPARLKFLKTPSTELSHVVRMLRELALGNPHIGFSLFHQTKAPLHQWTAPTREARFREALKPDWAPLHIVERHDSFQLEAFLSPAHWLTDRGELFLFINRRAVRNRTLLAAVRNAYRDTLGIHHEPSGVLYLDIEAGWVDVNVHPQKLEVRLLRQERLYGWLTIVLRKALEEQNEPNNGQTSWLKSENPQISVPLPETFIPMANEPQEERFTFGVPEPFAVEAKAPPFRYLGQAKQTYLVCEGKDALLFFDQHTLHEILLFEQLKAEYANQRLMPQRLSVPHVFRLPADLEGVLQTFGETLSELGLEIDSYGDHDVAVRSSFIALEAWQVERFVLDILKVLKHSEASFYGAREKSVEPVLAAAACHAATPRRQGLSPAESLALLKDLREIKPGWACPHGLPVVFRLNFSSLEKHFEHHP